MRSIYGERRFADTRTTGNPKRNPPVAVRQRPCAYGKECEGVLRRQGQYGLLNFIHEDHHMVAASKQAGHGMREEVPPFVPLRPLQTYIIVALVMGVAEFISFFIAMILGLLGLAAFVLCAILWLVIIGRAVFVFGPRGLWTLVSLPVAIYPFYMWWFLSNGCPGATLCL